jgi:predicted N-acyltransferase
LAFGQGTGKHHHFARGHKAGTEEAFDVLLQPQFEATLAGLLVSEIGGLMQDLAAVQGLLPPPKALAAGLRR